MNVGGAIVIFVLVWWMVFFAHLPMGVTGRWESTDDGVEGAEPGAPVDPDLMRKVKRTTIITIIISAIVIAVIASDVFNFRD